MSNEKWIPEIMYEENEDGTSSKIPFVMVPDGEVMPSLIYIFESRNTGRYEPGLEGDDVPVFEWDLHQYADMSKLKANLDSSTYDTVRIALGLEPLDAAIKKGSTITNSIRNKLSIPN